MKRMMMQAVAPIRWFFKLEAASGILLLFFTGIALLLANSGAADSYHRVLSWRPWDILAQLHLNLSLLEWINDGLMAVFFFVIGLEIKREILYGELRSLSTTLLPIAAAIGGMLVPALLYSLVNYGGEGAAGWGIPMATDIAFALGILTLAAGNTGVGIVIFLTALAIIDDLGAILVIALFYSTSVSMGIVAVGLAFLAGALFLNLRGVQRFLPYLAMGMGAWLCFLNGGIHPTIAGVSLGLLIPSNERNPESALLYRLEHRLEPWSAYGIMPLFALANAGVSFAGGFGELLSSVGLGILLGLCLGKPLGICLSVYLLHRFAGIPLPKNVEGKHFAGAGALAGIGFTMSLFIAALAFPDSPLLETAKMSIFAASVLSACTGFFLFRLFAEKKGRKFF